MKEKENRCNISAKSDKLRNVKQPSKGTYSTLISYLKSNKESF